ncbi:hypothetical protein BX600DRAFT_455077 [Xylariales sp. PMI_506]|nr:hypothetical protein BX600DRAFT_455077 [Xylariales sp. PMI_506]
MPSQISTAIQNTFIKAGANLTAQIAVQWSSKEPLPLDVQRIFEFGIFGFIGANIGYVWHLFLEHQFPTHVVANPRLAPILAPGEKDKDGAAAAPPPLTAAAVTGLDDGPVAVKVSWKNIVAKTVADQTFGLSLMITIFLIITNVARVPHLSDLLGVIQQKLWVLLLAGWHLWPLVAVCNFLWVPVRWRVIVSSCVGFLWNIFLSFMSMSTPVASTHDSH